MMETEALFQRLVALSAAGEQSAGVCDACATALLALFSWAPLPTPPPGEAGRVLGLALSRVPRWDCVADHWGAF